MTNFGYKRTTSENMKIAGIVDIHGMSIDVDGETKKLSTLLSPFEGSFVEIKVIVKNEEELDEPTSTFDPDDEEYDV